MVNLVVVVTAAVFGETRTPEKRVTACVIRAMDVKLKANIPTKKKTDNQPGQTVWDKTTQRRCRLLLHFPNTCPSDGIKAFPTN